MYSRAVCRFYQAGENVLEKQNAERRHGKRLDQPVDDQRDAQALRFPADILERGKVDVDHHRVDHDPDEHGHHQVDLCVFEARDPLRNWQESTRRA